MSKITIKNTCAIIVTYNPDDSFLERLQLISRQIENIIIVDNYSVNGVVESAIQQCQLVHFVKKNENEGIAKALNDGISTAVSLNFDWLITFDQDTLIKSNFFKVHQRIHNLALNEKFIVGSNYWNNNKKSPFTQCSNTQHELLERKTVITSGMVLSTRAFTEIGEFINEFFIDSVDHEYCMRARGLGYKIFISCEELMSHSIGCKHNSRMANIFPVAFNHPAFRKYYMARNTLVTIKKYFWQEPAWCLCQIMRLSVEFFSILVFENNKKEKTKSFLSGVKDSWVFEKF